jgi:hypothetical protein
MPAAFTVQMRSESPAVSATVRASPGTSRPRRNDSRSRRVGVATRGGSRASHRTHKAEAHQQVVEGP